MVYVVALPRQAHSPRITHVLRLNAVVRYAQRSSRAIRYAPLKQANAGPLGSMATCTGQSSLRVLAVRGSSFKKEEEDGHAMKGVFILLGGGGDGVGVSTNAIHILDYATKKHHHVTRSTFAAELFSACDIELITHRSWLSPCTS